MSHLSICIFAINGLAVSNLSMRPGSRFYAQVLSRQRALIDKAVDDLAGANQQSPAKLDGKHVLVQIEWIRFSPDIEGIEIEGSFVDAPPAVISPDEIDGSMFLA